MTINVGKIPEVARNKISKFRRDLSTEEDKSSYSLL